MVLLGGLNATFGPLLGAAVFTWGQDALARATDYWRAGTGSRDPRDRAGRSRTASAASLPRFVSRMRTA